MASRKLTALEATGVTLISRYSIQMGLLMEHCISSYGERRFWVRLSYGQGKSRKAASFKTAQAPAAEAQRCSKLTF
jgi:hypothetical protein